MKLAATLAVLALSASATVSNAGEWTGFYGGAQLGFSDIEADARNADGDDAFGGVHVGYNHDLGDYIIGGEIDYTFGDIELGNNAGTLESTARLKLRGGFDLGQSFVYATAGYAYADGDFGGRSADGDGYFVGFGAEYLLSDKISVGGEILYNEFDDFGGAGDLEATTVAARVSYRF